MALDQRSMIGSQNEVRSFFDDIGNLAPLAKGAVEPVNGALQRRLVAMLHTGLSFLLTPKICFSTMMLETFPGASGATPASHSPLSRRAGSRLRSSSVAAPRPA